MESRNYRYHKYYPGTKFAVLNDSIDISADNNTIEKLLYKIACNLEFHKRRGTDVQEMYFIILFTVFTQKRTRCIAQSDVRKGILCYFSTKSSLLSLAHAVCKKYIRDHMASLIWYISSNQVNYQ